MSHDPMRRARVEQLTTAEAAIRAAILAVEAIPQCDTRLSNATTRLIEAQTLVADFVDGVPARDLGQPASASPAPSQNAKSLGNTDVNGTRKNVKDVEFFGDGDTFKLICKASSESQGWMKSTKAMEIPGVGVLVQVTTQQRNPDGSYAVAEALQFVPGAIVESTWKDRYPDAPYLTGRRIRRAGWFTRMWREMTGKGASAAA